jgi:hypothetical protein
MHDGEVLRRPEGHDSETVEEEELTVGKRHVGVDAGGLPGEPGRPGAVDRARERWLTARCRGAELMARSTRNLTQGTARGTRTR